MRCNKHDFKLKCGFLPESGQIRGGALCARKRMEILLCYRFHPGFQIGEEDFGVTKSMVCRHVAYDMDHIVVKSGNWISPQLFKK